MNDKTLALLIFIPIFALEIILLPKLNQHHGMIITTKGDTIKGMIKGFSDQLIKYKPEKDSVYHQVSIDSVKEYRLTKSNALFRPVIRPETATMMFMLTLDTGKIKLYVNYERRGKTLTTHLYAEKQNNPVMQVFGNGPDQDYKNALLQLVSDNQQVTAYLSAQTHYRYQNVVDVIKIYNGEAIP